MSSFKVSISTDLAAYTNIWPRATLSIANPEAARAYPFQCRDVLDVWLCTIGEARNVSPFFVKVCDDMGAPLMLVPLGIERHWGMRFLSFLDGGVSDYNAPVVFPRVRQLDAPSIRDVWRRICDLAPPFDVVGIAKVPERVLDLENPLRVIANEQSAKSSQVMLGSKEKKLHSRRLKEKLKGLSKLGRVRFAVAQNELEANQFLRAMMLQKSRRYIETVGKDVFDRPGYRRFFQTMTDRLYSTGAVHLSALLVDEQIVAAHWGLHAAGRFYYLMPSFADGSWAKYSTGHILLQFLIEWASNNELELFDLGVGDEEYKQKYRDLEIGLSALNFAHSVPGELYFGLRRLKRSLLCRSLDQR